MSHELWVKANEILIDAERAADNLSFPSDRVARLVGRLSEVVREHLERVNRGLATAPAEVAALDEGQEYELVLRVKARVVEASDGAYVLALETREFLEAARVVVVDHDEISEAR